LTTISITALDRAPNLLREPYDLSLFFSAKNQPGHCKELCRDKIFPVCAPSMASRLKRPSDLRGQLFLHDARWINDWQSWLNQVAPGHGIDTTGPSFSLYSLAQQEAENGAGILIGHEILVQDSLRKGSLVAPFGDALEIDQALICATPAPVRPNSVIDKTIRMLAQDTKTHLRNSQ
jgi:DNA-binding transcriptional LysR family regulator